MNENQPDPWEPFPDRCDGTGPDDDSWQPCRFVDDGPADAGPRSRDQDDWVDAMLRMTDMRVDGDVLDSVLRLDGRWPEPRALDQHEVFWLRDRTGIDVRHIDPRDAAWLLAHLSEGVWDLHAQACQDEQMTTPSGLAEALAHLGVLQVADLDPHDWLESTDMVRWLRQRAGLPVPDDGPAVP